MDSEIMGIIDFINLSFRAGCAILGANILSENILKEYRLAADLNLGVENRRRVAEEKLIGDLLAEEVSFGLTRRMLNNLRFVLNEYKKMQTIPFSSAAQRELKAIPLSATEKILPHRNGSKASRLQLAKENGIDVPSGVSLTTLNSNEALLRREEIRGLVEQGIRSIEEETGKHFPFDIRKLDAKQRILSVSVRSGSFVSMPGILNTILNVALNDELVGFIIEHNLADEKFISDVYRRFLNYYGESVFYMRDRLFVDAIDRIKAEKGKPDMSISEFSASDLQGQPICISSECEV